MKSQNQRPHEVKSIYCSQSVVSYEQLLMMYGGVEKYLDSIKMQMASEMGRKLYEDGALKVTEKATNQGLIVSLELEPGK